MRRAAAALAGRHDHTVHSRHQARRGRPRAAGRARGDPGPVGSGRCAGGCAAAPLADPAFAHLLWQTVVGAWPIERERLHAYVEKAAREAATSTSWADPDEAFEAALHAVVDRVYDDPDAATPTSPRSPARITPAGWSNALGQKLVQLAMPGVPDIYQGTELWENSLVDPDNRRPVDFAERRRPAGPDRRRLAAAGRRQRRREAARRLPRAAPAPRPAGPVHRLPSGARRRPGRGSRVGLRPRRRDRRRDPACRCDCRWSAGWGDTYLSLPQYGDSSRRFIRFVHRRGHSGNRVPVSPLLDRYPVALLTNA